MGLGKILKTIALAIAASALFSLPAQAGDWSRADTHHFTIYSDGKASQLEDFAHELEKFDALLRALWNIPVLDRPQKLTIFMVSSSEEVEKLHGGTNVAGFYMPRTDGSFAVANRERGSSRSNLTGQEVLFHEYAHHFMFNNFSIPAPSWFVEGYAEFVATAQFKKNGQWIFGQPAYHRAAEVEYINAPSIEELLTYGSEDGPDRMRSNFYGWSWALTHMLYMDRGDGGGSIVRYLNHINRGEDSLSAAGAAFGDIDQLESDLRSYVKRRMEAKKSPNPIAYRDRITVVELDGFHSRLAELTMQRMAGYELAKTRDELAELAAGPGANADSWYQLARTEKSLAEEAIEEAETAEGESDEAKTADTPVDYAAAEAALDRALALDPDHGHANVEKGRLVMLRLADEGEWGDEQWAEARNYIVRANRANPLDPYALYHFAQSYTRRGDYNEQVATALHAAFEGAPEATEVRIAYAFDLANRGQFPAAIKILEVLANHPHYRAAGRAALNRVLQMQNGGVPVLAMDDVAVE